MCVFVCLQYFAWCFMLNCIIFIWTWSIDQIMYFIIISTWNKIPLTSDCPENDTESFGKKRDLWKYVQPSIHLLLQLCHMFVPVLNHDLHFRKNCCVSVYAQWFEVRGGGSLYWYWRKVEHHCFNSLFKMPHYLIC